MPVTRADELEALAERVEKLTGPNREVDALIFETVTGVPAHRPAIGFSGRAVTKLMQGLPSYTSSLDAAMSLVPEGHHWKCGYSRNVPHNAEVIDYKSHKGTFIGESDLNRAIALTAACLRAHASIIREAGR